MEVTLHNFTEHGPHCADFDRLVLHAIQSNSGLHIDFARNEVTTILGLDESAVCFSNPQIDLWASSRSVSASVLLPILEPVTSISLSHTDIYSFRREHRTIADFWARNLFHVFTCSDTLSLRSSSADPDSKTREMCSELAKRYLWYFRSIHDEPLLSTPHVSDKMFIASYVPTVEFLSPALESGMRVLRQVRNDSIDNPQLAPSVPQQIAQFDACRTELLSLLD